MILNIHGSTSAVQLISKILTDKIPEGIVITKNFISATFGCSRNKTEIRQRDSSNLGTNEIIKQSFVQTHILQLFYLRSEKIH